VPWANLSCAVLRRDRAQCIGHVREPGADAIPRLECERQCSDRLLLRGAGAPFRGDLVLARAPLWARKLAAERGYLPLNMPIVKRVAAVAGDVVCASGDTISIDGRPVAHRLTSDRMGRPLPQWDGCEILGSGEFFLLMADVPDSFDGRYFGVTERRNIISRLVPLWTR
jgi:conjugative transfer signal peptidase TraF